MIPLRDQNPGIRFPAMTVSLILAAVAIYVFVQLPQGDSAFYEYATIPCEFTGGGPVSLSELNTGICDSTPAPGLYENKIVAFSLLSSIFLHGGFAHLLGNMWSLWIFGNNVEDAFGRGRYLVFYLAGGVIASVAHILMNPGSTIPVVGASGAIAAVMGAYIILFPRARITTWAVMVPLAVPASVFLAIWFVSQFWIAGSSPDVAWEAHVAGFAFGAFVAFVMRKQLIDRLARHAFQFVR
ncbi:MAG: rhomboid family intramembrane serine protease [Acidimicrobiia bacterium]|nr:rhomboid family intramembrane serine protease [Acidimicrobiia bacterium]